MGRLRSATTRTDIDWPLQPWNGEGFPEYEYLTDEHYTYDRNGNISSLERLNGTEYAAISMTRTGNRLTTADVTEWDGDDEMEYSIYNYNHNANGAMTFDSMSGINGTVFSWNAAGLLHAFVDDDSSERVEIIWLSDGTKVKMDGDVDSPRYYRGSFVYKDVSISVPTGYDEGDYDTYDFEGLESIAHSEGRFVATDWTTTGVPTLSDRHFVRDLVGSTVTVIDVARAAVASNLPTLNAALVEQDAYLAYGDRLSASAMTLKTDTDNRYRFNGKERHDWAGYPYIDYGARMYNPLIGSWLSPDPLADKYTSTSPYAFCAGDPVNYVDPDGNWVWAVVGGVAEYGMQVYRNYKEGYSGVDAWIKQIDVLDVALSAFNPFGKCKLLGTVAIEATKAAVDVKIETGISMNKPIEQVTKETIINSTTTIVAGKVLKSGTSEAVEQTTKTADHAAVSAGKASAKAARHPLSPKAAKAADKAESSAELARKDQVTAKIINSTVGQAPNATKQAATSIVNYQIINREWEEEHNKNHGK